MLPRLGTMLKPPIGELADIKAASPPLSPIDRSAWQIAGHRQNGTLLCLLIVKTNSNSCKF